MEMGNAAPGNPPGKFIDTGQRRTPRLSGSDLLVGDLLKSKAWNDDEGRRVSDELFFEGPEWRPLLSRFVVLIVLSRTIAAFRLISNSAAIVVEAMPIAPRNCREHVSRPFPR